MQRTPQNYASALAHRWTKQVLSHGYIQLPSLVLKEQQSLGLSAVDLNILLHLLRVWIDPGKRPVISKKTIAAYMGLDASTVRRRIKAMEERALIKRVQGKRTSNAYDLSGLIEKLRALAEEATLQKAKERDLQRPEVDVGVQ